MYCRCHYLLFLDPIGNRAQTHIVRILIIAELCVCRVADQLQFVGSGGINGFHHRRKGMPTAVWSVFPAPDTVLLHYGIVDTGGPQRSVERSAVYF